ncbi:MAG TPA: hypothetical protein VND44_08300 [Acidimicrobiales bacterium]|nr:hypothetical protein [Acidimicrobiales bacterium]
MNPGLSVCCRTDGPAARVVAVLEQLRDVADEIVVAADSRLGDADVAQLDAVADRLVRFEYAPPMERSLAWLHSLCSHGWILHIDGDEVASRSLIEALPGLVAAPDVLQYHLPLRWLFPDGGHWLDGRPWWPDFQPRLVRNDPAVLRFGGPPHSPVVPTPARRFVDLPLYHLDCVVTTTEQRRAKAAASEAREPRTTVGSADARFLPEEHAERPPAPVPPEDREAIDQVLRATPRRVTRVVTAPYVGRTAIDRFWNRRLPAGEEYRASIACWEADVRVEAGVERTVYFQVENLGDFPWYDLPADVRLTCRWWRDGGLVAGYGPGSPLPATIDPGRSAIVPLDVTGPATGGPHVLEIDLVHGGVRWFGAPCRLQVDVDGMPSEERSAALRHRPAEAEHDVAQAASAVTSLEGELAEADGRARRLEEELAAFGARRSVRAAVAVADAAHGARARARARVLARARARGAKAAPASLDADPRPTSGGQERTTGNTAKWQSLYAGVESPRAYDDSVTYRLGAEFLSGCETVEDWGCGLGWMRNFVPADRYIGVDGSYSRFADRLVDLETYTSNAPGIFMRHILEHNYGWERILQNALASFGERFVLVTFTPYGETTREIAFHDDPGVPDISFAKDDLTRHFAGLTWRDETHATDTQYGTETIYFIERPPRSASGRHP